MGSGGGRGDPLEALKRVRRLKVDEAEAALARAFSVVGAYTAELETARGAHDELAEAHRRERAQQRAREDAGGSARDLGLGQAFLRRRKLELVAALAAVRAAEARVMEARAKAELAREALANARASAEVVERQHERQIGAEKRTRDARAEADAEDLVAARRRTTEG